MDFQEEIFQKLKYLPVKINKIMEENIEKAYTMASFKNITPL